MGTTKQVFTGDIRQLESAYEQLSRQNLRLEQQVNKLALASEQGNRRAHRGMIDLDRTINQGVQSVTRLATQYIGLAAILQGVNAELQEMHRLQAGSAATQTTVAGSQAAVIKNMVGVGSSDRAKFLDEIKQIRKDTRFPDINALNFAASEGLAAGGDPRSVANLVRAAARLSREKPEELNTISAAALDIERASGISDPRANLGFILAAGGEARIKSLENTTRNVAPAVISGVATVPGQDRQQASREFGAFFSAASLMTGDVRGDQTSTFTQSYAVQLRDFFEKGREINVAGRKLRIKPPSDPGTFSGRMEALQQNQGLGRQFIEGASFERQYQISAEQSIVGGSQFSNLYRNVLPRMQFNPAEYEQTATDLENLTREIRQANRQWESQGNVQSRDLTSGGGEQATVRATVEDALAVTRQYSLAPFGLRYAADYSKSLHDQAFGLEDSEAIDRLRARQSDIMYDRSGLFGPGRRRTSLDQLSPTERNDYQFLAEQIQVLQRMQADQLRELKTQTGIMSQPRPTGAAGERGGQSER